MKNSKIQLIYECFDNPDLRDEILAKCQDKEIKQHIEKLYSLIAYQIGIINDQRIEIVAEKHKTAWLQYEAKGSATENIKQLSKEEAQARKC